MSVTGDVMSWNATDPPITVEDMLARDKLITVDQARAVLQSTEPLAFRSFVTGDGDVTDIRFELASDWNAEVDTLAATSLIDGWVTLHAGSEAASRHQLTLDGLYKATSQFGLGYKYVSRCPGDLIQDQLDYWFRTGLPNKELQLMLLGEDQVVTALTRESVDPFSNLTLLDKTFEIIQQKFPNTPVYVDRDKLSHSQRLTHLQLVLPEVARVITGTGEVDDRWWGGLQWTNSLTAEKQTSVEPFMFRQKCTNGYIQSVGEDSIWSRKTGGQDQEAVLAWAESAVNEALGSFEGIFDRVQGLTELRLDANTVHQTAQGLFEQYRIPVAARQRIIENLVETDNLTMYGLNNAVTQAANGDVSASQQQRLMRTGGDVIDHAERCNGCHRMLPEGVDAHHVH